MALLYGIRRIASLIYPTFNYMVNMPLTSSSIGFSSWHAVKVAANSYMSVANESPNILDMVSNMAQRGTVGVHAVHVLGVEGYHENAVVPSEKPQDVIGHVRVRVA